MARGFLRGGFRLELVFGSRIAHVSAMVFIRFTLAVIALWASISSATEGPRVRLRVPSDQLRLNIMRFSDEGIGHVTNGDIQNGRFYPRQALDVAALGATDCQSVLDQVQRFPLEGMLQAKYITPETFKMLESSRDYLDANRVTFANVYSMVKREDYDAAQGQILSSQIALAPEFSNSGEYIPVTTATMFLVAGYKVKPEGITPAPLPWHQDPAFANVAAALKQNSKGVDFELGRTLQVTAGHVDHTLKAILITLAQEMSFFKADFNNIRIFVHSYKNANTAAYKRRTPSLQVVATDPQNPENVILMTTLAGIFSPEYPWDFSGPIQLLRDLDRAAVTVPKAWNFISAVRGLVRSDLDYYGLDGKRTPSPIVLQDNTIGYQEMIWSQVRQLGVTQDKYQAVIDLLNGKLALSDSGANGRHFVDPLTIDRVFLREKAAANSVSISNLNAEESKKDPKYELRVLFGSVMNYRVMLDSAKVPTNLINQATYAVSTTSTEIADRLAKLQPSRQSKLPWQRDWSASSDSGAITLNFTQTTARTFFFTMADLNRLAKEHPDVFEDMRESKRLRQGYFFARNFIARPTGL